MQEQELNEQYEKRAIFSISPMDEMSFLNEEINCAETYFFLLFISYISYYPSFL